MAFLDGRPGVLLVADTGNNAVHVIDIVHEQHLGHLLPPGDIVAPRGVASKGEFVAVSTWQYGPMIVEEDAGHAVKLFAQSTDGTWSLVREVTDVFFPSSLRFSSRDSELVVATHHGVVAYSMHDATFAARPMMDGYRYRNVFLVEEFSAGLWVASNDYSLCCSDLVYHVIHDDVVFGMSSCVPHLGLLLRHRSGWIWVNTSVEFIAMASMSQERVSWMSAVVRGCFSASRKK